MGSETTRQHDLCWDEEQRTEKTWKLHLTCLQELFCWKWRKLRYINQDSIPLIKHRELPNKIQIRYTEQLFCFHNTPLMYRFHQLILEGPVVIICRIPLALFSIYISYSSRVKQYYLLKQRQSLISVMTKSWVFFEVMTESLNTIYTSLFYPYQKDERAFPGNLRTLRNFFSPRP